MKILIAFIVLNLVSFGYCDSGLFYNEAGVFKTYKWKVRNKYLATDKEKDDYVVSFSSESGNVVDVTAGKDEVALSTTCTNSEELIAVADQDKKRIEKILLREMKKLNDLKSLNDLGIDKQAEIDIVNSRIGLFTKFYKK